nr:hypothetical protein Iba_chr14bCG8990 [Ipomoea batatas]
MGVIRRRMIKKTQLPVTGNYLSTVELVNVAYLKTLKVLGGLYSEEEQKTSRYLGLKTGFYNDDEVKTYWREIWDDEVAWDAARSHAKHISKNAHKTVRLCQGLGLEAKIGRRRRRCPTHSTTWYAQGSFPPHYGQ